MMRLTKEKLSFIISLIMTSIIVLFIVSTPAKAVNAPDVYELQLKKVLDGDTVEFIKDNLDFKCRIYGIDTPEKFKGKKLNEDVRRTGIPAVVHQEAGLQSTEYAENFFDAYTYRVEDYGADLYQRHLCVVYKNDISYNESILKDGYAVVYKNGKYTNNKELKARLNSAQEEGLNQGLNVEFKDLMQKLRE
jgi:endonuclease YncB( thermonuclease family)